jgi:hypothetical protein
MLVRTANRALIRFAPSAMQPQGLWRHVIRTASLVDPIRAPGLVSPTIAVLDAALAGYWDAALVARAFDRHGPRLLAVLDGRLRYLHAIVDHDVLDAARGVLAVLAEPLDRLLLLAHGGAPPPAQSAPGTRRRERSIGEALAALERWTAPPDPVPAAYRCPRCGSGAVRVSDTQAAGRHLFEVGCEACGLLDDWYAGDARGWAVAR